MSNELELGKILGRINILDLLEFIKIPLISKTTYYYTYGYNNEVEYILYKDEVTKQYCIINKEIELYKVEDLLIRHLEQFLNHNDHNTIISIVNSIPETNKNINLKETDFKKVLNLLIRATKKLSEPLAMFETEYTPIAYLTNKKNQFANVIYSKPELDIRLQLFNNSSNHLLKQIRVLEKNHLVIFDILDINNSTKIEEYLKGSDTTTHTLFLSEFNFEILNLIQKQNCEEITIHYSAKTKNRAQLIGFQLYNLKNDFTFDYDKKNEDIFLNIISTNNNENNKKFRNTVLIIDELFKEKFYRTEDTNNVFYNTYSKYLHRSSIKTIGNKLFLNIKTTQKDHYLEIIHLAIQKTLNTIKINYNEYL